MVTASAGMPIFAPAWPTVVIPVRIGSSPVMKFARPAVQLASFGVIASVNNMPLLGYLVEDSASYQPSSRDDKRQMFHIIWRVVTRDDEDVEGFLVCAAP